MNRERDTTGRNNQSRLMVILELNLHSGRRRLLSAVIAKSWKRRKITSLVLVVLAHGLGQTFVKFLDNSRPRLGARVGWGPIVLSCVHGVRVGVAWWKAGAAAWW